MQLSHSLRCEAKALKGALDLAKVTVSVSANRKPELVNKLLSAILGLENSELRCAIAM